MGGAGITAGCGVSIPYRSWPPDAILTGEGHDGGGGDDVGASKGADQVGVLLVDDQPAFRRAVATLIASSDQLIVTGQADTGESALAVLTGPRAADTGLVLIDINMPGIGGIETARRIHAARPDLVVVLMSTYDAGELPAEAAGCGAASYLHKEHLSAELLVDVWRLARHPGGGAGLDPGAGR